MIPPSVPAVATATSMYAITDLRRAHHAFTTDVRNLTSASGFAGDGVVLLHFWHRPGDPLDLPALGVAGQPDLGECIDLAWLRLVDDRDVTLDHARRREPLIRRATGALERPTHLGMKTKLRLDPWYALVFQVLYALRRPRGTRWAPFGRAGGVRAVESST